MNTQHITSRIAATPLLRALEPDFGNTQGDFGYVIAPNYNNFRTLAHECGLWEQRKNSRCIMIDCRVCYWDKNGISDYELERVKTYVRDCIYTMHFSDSQKEALYMFAIVCLRRDKKSALSISDHLIRQFLGYN